MKRLILMLALSIGASAAIADCNPATANTDTSSLFLPMVIIDDVYVADSVTLQMIEITSSGNYLFELDPTTVTLNKLSTGASVAIADCNPATANTDTSSLFLPMVIIDDVYVADSVTLKMIEITSSVNYLFELDPTTVTLNELLVEPGVSQDVYAVGDEGPAGGVIAYVADAPFTCGENLDQSCSYLELYTGGTFPGAWCPDHDSWNNEWGSEAITNNAIGNGAAATVLMQGRCSGPSRDIHEAVLNGVDDWYMPTPLESGQVCTSKMAERVSGYSSRLKVRHWTSNKNGIAYGIFNKTPDCSSGRASLNMDGNYATWAIRSF